MAIHVKVPVHVANQASLFVLNVHVTNGGAYALGHVVFTKMRRALAPAPCILIAIIGYLQIASESKRVGQKRVYESTWAHQGTLPGLHSLRMVVPLSVRRRGTTHMDPRLDLYRSLCWRIVYV